jgi:serine/threonine-protein phosphatase PGAM5
MTARSHSRLYRGRPKRVLYLVRHGQFDTDAESPDGLGGGLTALGRKQARLTAKRLSELPVSVIYHSDLRRAAETAALLHEALPRAQRRATPWLRECIPAVPQAFKQKFSRLPAAQLARDQRQAERAFRQFFRFSRSGARHELLVCHGNLIRYFVCRVLRVPPAAWGYMDLRQCSVTEVVLQRGWSRVTMFGDVGHLPKALWTYL